MGKPEAAVEEMKRARDLDPLSLFFNDEMGVAFEWQQQYDKAIEWFQKAMELDPNWGSRTPRSRNCLREDRTV